MTFIYAIRVEPSVKPTRAIRQGGKERDDLFNSFIVYDAATPAQPVAAAMVDRLLTGPADRVVAALRPAVQTGGRIARLQFHLVYQFCHSRGGHYVGAVRRRMERNGRDYGYESRRDGSPAGLADQSRGDHYRPHPFNVDGERRSIAHPDRVGLC